MSWFDCEFEIISGLSGQSWWETLKWPVDPQLQTCLWVLLWKLVGFSEQKSDVILECVSDPHLQVCFLNWQSLCVVLRCVVDPHIHLGIWTTVSGGEFKLLLMLWRESLCVVLQWVIEPHLQIFFVF